MAALGQRDRRALALLGAALALFLVLQLDFFAPGGGGTAAVGDERIEALEQRLQLAQVRARQRPLTEAELAAAQRRLERLENGLLASQDAALAQAEMRSLVGALLEAEGIPMQSSAFGTVALERERYAMVPLAVNFSCGIEQVVNLMAAIANAPQLLTTRELRMQPDKAEVKSVRVRLTVAGYLPLERTPELVESAAGGSLGIGL